MLDHHLLAEHFAHARAHDAAEHVGGAAGREGDDHGDGPAGEILRGRRRRDTREGGQYHSEQHASHEFLPAFSGLCANHLGHAGSEVKARLAARRQAAYERLVPTETRMSSTRVAIAGLGAIGRTLPPRPPQGVPGGTLARAAAPDPAKAQAWLPRPR